MKSPQLPIVTPDFLMMATGLQRCKTKPKPTMPKKTDSEEIAVKIDRRKQNTKIKLAATSIPIMSPHLQAKVEAAIAMYMGANLWREWGLKTLRSGGSVLLLEGPPGTGKTMIARYLSAKVGRGLVTLNMKDVGGKAPGDTERRLAETFERAKLQGWATLFLDEADTLAMSRDLVGADSLYMVGVINELLMQIAAYAGLIVLATNRSHVLDPALHRRLLAKIVIPRPEAPERLRLWQQKIPKQYPLQLTQLQYEKLADLNMTGAEIENAIILESSNAIVEGRMPSFATLQNVAISFAQQG